MAGSIDQHDGGSVRDECDASSDTVKRGRYTMAGLADLGVRGWTAALDIVFPISCLGCKSRGKFICEQCAAAMPRLERPYCAVCASPGASGVCSWCREHSPAIDAIRSPYIYVPNSPIYRAITQLKYRGMRTIASELAELLYGFLSGRRYPPPEVVIPVPSHHSRIRERGYGQAALIAVALAHRATWEADTRSLVRVFNAPSQLETESREERWDQVRDGFQCSTRIEGANVLLVDDLVTTGSTASACATALKLAGARRVVCISVARAP